MTDYQATNEQWDQVRKCADVIGSSDCSAILELRARVEVLEAALHRHIVKTESNTTALFDWVESLEDVKRKAAKVYEINDPLQLTPEQAQQITDLLTPNSSAGLTSSNYPAKPDSSLVERVSSVLCRMTCSDVDDWNDEARAAIREVAAWMTSNPDHHFPPALVFVLEQETEHG